MEGNENKTSPIVTCVHSAPQMECSGETNSSSLVGPMNEDFVVVNSVPCRALIDSGSQITSITEEFWHQHPTLGNLRPEEVDIRIEGAGGHEVPHQGVLRLNLSFLDQTYAAVPVFVVPATQYRKSVPLLLGTNVIRASKQDLEKRLGREFPSCLKDEHPAWHAAYQQVRVKSPGREPQTVPQVRYAGKQPVKIKPGEHRCITVKAPWSRDRSPYTVLIGPPDGKQFIKNVVVEEAVADVVHGRTLVHLYNQSPYNIVIKRGQTVASISALSSVETVIPSDPTPDLGSTAGLSHDQQSSSPPDKAPVQSDIPEMDLKEAAVLNQEQQEKLEELLRRNSDVFSVNQFDLGCTSAVKHEIPLIDNKPMRQPYRRIPPTQFQEVRRHLQDMVEAGAIRSSQSPYASPIVVARKKDGSIRVCIDYRQLNAKMARDAFPMPRIEEALDALGDAEFYSTLDLTSGYWQVEVAEHDKPKTAFTTPMGLFECN